MNIIEQKPQWNEDGHGNYAEGFDGFTVRRNDFIAKGIRWFSRWDELKDAPPVSHTFKIVGPDKTIEAFSDGVHYGNLSSYLKDPNVALLIRRPICWTPDMGRRMTAEAAKHLGHKYGYALIAGMALSRSLLGRFLHAVSFGWSTRGIDALMDSKRQEICSELVAMADRAQPELQHGAIFKWPSNTITPVMLFGDNTIYEPGAVELVL